MIIEASVPWCKGPEVGCFDPAIVLHRLGEAFGDELEFDFKDLYDGHYERVVQSANKLGIDLDRPAVLSAARKVRDLSPRYRFRLRVGIDAYVSGTVDRYSVTVLFAEEAEFPEPARE